MVCMLHKLGFDYKKNQEVYEHLLEAVRSSRQLRNDWFIRSRTALELRTRCNTLVKLIGKENQEIEEKALKRKKEEDSESSGPSKKRRV